MVRKSENDGIFRRESTLAITNSETATFQEKCQALKKLTIGHDLTFASPFYESFSVPLLYLDHTASSRALENVENFIADMVLPAYANTHTKASWTGRQSSYLRAQSKDILRSSLNLKDDTAVIYTGAGTTSATNKLAYNLAQKYHHYDRTIVFMSESEHHSNMLPWTILKNVTMVYLPYEMLDQPGLKDFQMVLDKIGKNFSKKTTKVIFSLIAASNLTGQLYDYISITEKVKTADPEYDIFWDFATAGNYTPIFQDQFDFDAVFMSPHKFLGGVNTSGVLLCKIHLLEYTFPLVKGGGSVMFVSRQGIRYLKNVEDKEESGTPNIIADIRAGLAFKVRHDLDIDEVYKQSLLRTCFLTKIALGLKSP